MIIGDKENFAIEFELAEPKHAALEGRLCYWMKGRRVGNFDVQSLRDVLFASTNVLLFQGKREFAQSVVLWQAGAWEAFKAIDRILYWQDESIVDRHEIPQIDDAFAGRFQMLVRTGSFDGYKAFAIRHEGKERMLVSREPYTEVDGDYTFEQPVFDAVFAEALHWLNAEYDVFDPAPRHRSADGLRRKLIDFRLITETPDYSLYMELHPGTFDIDAPDHRGSVFFSESAFGFIAPCIREAWPAYANWGHWGVTEIPAGAWREIIGRMRTLKDRLAALQSASEIPDLGFVLSDAKDEYFFEFEATRRGIIALIDAMGAWLELKLESADRISVLGV